ncbi:MAG TPA: adenylosuccinate synthetase [Terriglobia bacterium]|jgi:adenylosuccinate synthase|nr:adenylosuccinate synthetase [Terriglobia bacterium]
MSLWVVVGGQFGSEGKGKVSAFITLQEGIDICIRCGGPNSGHSFVGPDGTTALLRQLPTGYIRPGTRLLIAAGALIAPQVLKAELDRLGIDPRRVGVDRNTMVIEDADRRNEHRLMLSERLSSTLCGVGSAVSRRVLRGEDVRLARDAAAQYPWLKELLTDVSAEANEALDSGKKVLVEGTQGFGLSLYHTAEYPKATSRDTTAAGFLSESGLSPRLVTEIIVVLRTFPIRVAGDQAGALKNEVTWEQIRRESGYPHEIEERTSVTNKVRRVGRFEWELARAAVRVNRPSRIAINGLDYLDFASYGVPDEESLPEKARAFAEQLKQELALPLAYLGVGPSLDHIIQGGADAPIGQALEASLLR